MLRSPNSHLDDDDVTWVVKDTIDAREREK
jgi:hypothetical protein